MLLIHSKFQNECLCVGRLHPYTSVSAALLHEPNLMLCREQQKRKRQVEAEGTVALLRLPHGLRARDRLQRPFMDSSVVQAEGHYHLLPHQPVNIVQVFS